LQRKLRYYCKRVHGSSLIKQFVSDQIVITKELDIKVELDDPIRWNSTHDMLRTALRRDWEIAKTTLLIEVAILNKVKPTHLYRRVFVSLSNTS
jgi:hypothetical protein